MSEPSTVVITVTTNSVRRTAAAAARLEAKSYVERITVSVDDSPPRRPVQVEHGWTDDEFAAWCEEGERRLREWEERQAEIQREHERRRRRHRSMLEALDLGEVGPLERVELGLGFSIGVNHEDRLQLHVPPTDRRPWGTTRGITPEEAQRIFRDLNLASMLNVPDDEAAIDVLRELS